MIPNDILEQCELALSLLEQDRFDEFYDLQDKLDYQDSIVFAYSFLQYVGFHEWYHPKTNKNLLIERIRKYIDEEI